MSKPFDATLKNLFQERPRDLLAEFDAPPTLPVRVLSQDLSTVSKATDLVLGLGDPLQEVVHIEFQSSSLADLHRHVLANHALLHFHLDVPVHSLVILLRPQALHSNTSGTILYEPRPGRGKMDFRYEVVRLWERPVEQLLTGPLGTLPLAPLGQLPAGLAQEDALESVIDGWRSDCGARRRRIRPANC